MNPSDGVPLRRVDLRQAVPEDEPFLARILESTAESMFAGMLHDGGLKQSLIEMQYRALTQSRQHMFPHARRQVIVVDGQLAGYCSTSIDAERMRLVDIALLPAFRHQGVGTIVLRRILREADGYGFDVDLRVERDNLAIRLYERFGFTVTADEGPYLTMQRPARGPGSMRDMQSDRPLDPDPPPPPVP